MRKRIIQEYVIEEEIKKQKFMLDTMELVRTQRKWQEGYLAALEWVLTQGRQVES